MNCFYLLFILFIWSCESHVSTGLDNLESQNFKRIQNKNIALIINHTSLNKNGDHVIDLLVDKPNININYGNETQVTKYIGINSVEFPFDNSPYTNEEYVSFFYEIFERTYLGANYSKVVRNNDFRKTLYNVLADFESSNIKDGIDNIPELIKFY